MNVDPTVSVKVFNLVNTSMLKAGEKSTMNAIAGYAHTKSSSVADADGSPFAYETTVVANDIEQISAELQLASKAFHDYSTM